MYTIIPVVTVTLCMLALCSITLLRSVHILHGVQGPKDVYRGLTGAVLGTIPTAILYFTTYEWCKARLEACKAPSAVTHLASASAGAVMSAFIRVPTDTIKHRVQAYMETNVFLVRVLCSHCGGDFGNDTALGSATFRVQRRPVLVSTELASSNV